MYSQLLVGAALVQGVLSTAQAFNQLEGSRQSVIIDETARRMIGLP